MTDTPAEPAPASAPGARHPVSIQEFLTDGSMARICTTIGDLTGARVRLLDADGSVILPAGDDDDDGDHDPWITVPAPVGDAPSARAPILVDQHRIGEFTLHADAAELDPERGRSLEEIVHLLAQLTTEFCHEAAEMRSRIRELGALFRLSSVLAGGAAGVDRVLSVALDLALSVLELDAGSIVLFPDDAEGVPETDDEREVSTRASANLSEAWLSSPEPLSRRREFDRLVLAGQTLAIPDLLDDDRVLSSDRCRRENIRSFLSAAMIHRGRAIGVIRLYGRTPRTFRMADQRLIRSIGEQAATAVAQARLLEIERRERQLEHQLRLASAVQRRMQPRDLPALPGLDVAARSEPSYELGGDLHDVFELGDPPALGMVIGDVVGKGVPAALLMSAVRAGLRAHAVDPRTMADTIERTNRDMCRDSLPNEFTTLWYGVVDPASRALTYCSAGHEPPFLIRRRPGVPPTRDDVRPLAIGGLVLGITPGETYEAHTLALRPGDVLVAHTDGVPDARNFDDEKWGWQRLVDAALDALVQHPDATASVILQHILWSLRRFTGLRRQVDDETMIVLRVGESSPE